MRKLSENAANTRTLIMGLVLSLAVMLPLKFYTAGEEVTAAQDRLEIMAKVNSVKAMHLANLRRASSGFVARRTVSDSRLAMQLAGSNQAVLGVSTSCINAAQAQEMVRSVIANSSSSQNVEFVVFRIKEILQTVCK